MILEILPLKITQLPAWKTPWWYSMPSNRRVLKTFSLRHLMSRARLESLVLPLQVGPTLGAVGCPHQNQTCPYPSD